MTKIKPIAKNISTIYFKGAILLLAFYVTVFSASILYTEDANSERRLIIVAPHHFQAYTNGVTGKIEVDPLLTLYDGHQTLPNAIKRRINPKWEGVTSIHFEDESEFSIYAEKVMTPNGKKTVYAVSNINATEWDDNALLAFEVIHFLVGAAIFFIMALFINRQSLQISLPFVELVKKLNKSRTAAADKEFSAIDIENVSSCELAQTLTAINEYRKHIAESMAREKSFTRYVSHELRTPMMVIKGNISVLKRNAQESNNKQLERIHEAVEQMEQLTATFLLLARNETNSTITAPIDNQFVAKLSELGLAKAEASNTTLAISLLQEFELTCEPLLVYAACQNIVLNALNNTIEGHVDVTLSSQGIEVIDNGVGLNEKARGYEGFGIGLVIVRDICEKYNWTFSLANNEAKGCTAKITF